jgi:trimeric autotransporter adhesin
MNLPFRGTSTGCAAAGLVFLSTLFAAVAAVPGDEHWDKQFGAVGTSDPLYSVTSVSGKVYVGGIFTAAGNTRANYVAGYDGTNWFQLNNGLSGGLNLTYAFALANDGTNLYAGGWFTNADNSGAQYIARWDGSSWWPLAGGNPVSIVEAVKISGTNFFVGGASVTNSGPMVNGIARWDGSAWHALGAGITGVPAGSSLPVVEAIEYDGTNLYAGGGFTQAGTVSAANVARWDGTTWTAMGAGLPGSVGGLTRLGSYLYAAGSFTNAGLAITNLAKWDGSAWSAVGAGANAAVRAMISDGTNLYVGGDFTLIGGISANRVAKWNGVTWSALGTGINAFGAGASPGVYKMAFDASGRLIAAGNFNQAGSVGASHVAGWDGTNWFALGGGTSMGMTHFLGDVQSLLFDGTNLYAGGVFTEAGSVIVNGIGRWNGTNWSALGSAPPGMIPGSKTPQVKALARIAGLLYAGGAFTNLGGTAAGSIAAWDGNNWNNLGTADSTVRALAYNGTYLWVGGSFTNIGGVSSTGLAEYASGFGWLSLGPATGGSQQVFALAVDGSDVYVGGNFTAIDGVSATNIIHWNGSGWVPLGIGVNSTVNAIAASNGIVYAGGAFTLAGGAPVNRIARWNGTTWSALGSGVTAGASTPSISAIALLGNYVYAAGSFTNAGGVAATGLAKWDGTNWFGLGSGLYLTVGSGGAGSGHSLATWGNDIYVGGTFNFAGDKPSSFIGRWNDQSNFYPTPHPMLTRETRLTNGQFQFRLAGTSGESYILQGSTNLSAWIPLLTNSATLYDYTDPSSTSFRTRFYRAVLGP